MIIKSKMGMGSYGVCSRDVTSALLEERNYKESTILEEEIKPVEAKLFFLKFQ